MKKLFALLCGFLLVGGSLGVSHAQPITINVKAVVSMVTDESNLLDGAVQIGDMIQASYTYDPSDPDWSSIDPSLNWAEYFYQVPNVAMDVKVNGLRYQAIHQGGISGYGDFVIEVLRYPEQYNVQSYANTTNAHTSAPDSRLFVKINLWGYKGTTDFIPVDMVNGALALDDWNYNLFTISYYDNPTYIPMIYEIQASVFSIEVIPAPAVPAPPIADAGADMVVFSEVTLDGSGSYDSDGTVVSYTWSLRYRGNSANNRTAEDVNPTISNLAPGFYDVILTVTDNDDLSGTDTMLLAVAGQCAGWPQSNGVLTLDKFKIVQKEKAGVTTISMSGNATLPALFLGSTVQSRITIELFNVLSGGGDCVLSQEVTLPVTEGKNKLLIGE